MDNVSMSPRVREARKKTLYGVDYRSMATGYHGILVYKTESRAISVSRKLHEMELNPSAGKEAGNEDAERFFDFVEEQVPGLKDRFREIDFRSIKRVDGNPTYETEDYSVKIVNAVAYDVDYAD